MKQDARVSDLSTLSRRSMLRLGLAGAVSALAASRVYGFRASGKKGFCGAEELYSSRLGCNWYYNWSLEQFRQVKAPFIPMVWGWHPGRTPAQLSRLSGRQPILFGFNEPDARNQANMSVPEALAAWPRIEDLADEIVSPSCVNSRGRWMTNFMLQADRRRLKIDSIGVHSYSAPNAEQVVERLEETYRLYGRPLWVTEIGVADWRAAEGRRPNRYKVDDTIRFLQEICAYMDGTPWIKGYSWLASGTFGDGKSLSTSAFFDGSGRPSPIFEAYARIQ
ncbi:glycosyl hydrolase [Paracoccus onubensis]|uniref:glycosyl hydrolase n=1 Tax=Paracoccus onubensis TaxID=1675788 RepID=UPI0015FFF1C8|nr:glycosyl hydrolase [Paracoccus onubensis]